MAKNKRLDPNLEAVQEMRRVAMEGLGINLAFIDDNMMVIVGLAQRAVLAGLASDCTPDMQARFSEAAEKHRGCGQSDLPSFLPP